MAILSTIKNKIRNFLFSDIGGVSQIIFNQRMDYYAFCAMFRIWYRGDSMELSDLYRQLNVAPTTFWKAISSDGMEIRKIHTGLPKLIVKTLTNIVINDYNGVEFGDKSASQTSADVWCKIEKDNDIQKLLEKCIKNILITGDGAFKISFDKSPSDLPIIEFVKSENVDFVYNRGRISEVVFVTEYTHNSKKYELKERYGYGYIRYELTLDGKPVPNNSIPQLQWIDCEGVEFDKSVILAVPVIYGENEKEDGRGESIFDGKLDNFDALDEVVSQWMDALRANRTKEYIPENIIPRDPETGRLLKPNAFDNRFIAVGQDMVSEKSDNKIVVAQSNIPHDSYLATYITVLDLCLQGIISPSTLGIDTKKLDNSEAQREKEKTTLYTRGNIVEVINAVLPKLVVSAVCANQIWNNQTIDKPEKVTVKFGDYANPSFESQVETVGKAKTQGIMSTEAGVDELYGDTKDQAWKNEEVKRIKEEQGIIIEPEPSVSDDSVIVGF